MARKIDLTVGTCFECPYCHFEAEIGEHFCVATPVGLDLSLTSFRKDIHIDCPLPFVRSVEEDVATTEGLLDRVGEMYRAGGILGKDAKKLLEDISKEPTSFKCTALQVTELNDCPEEWIKQVVHDEEVLDKREGREILTDVERLFEGFNETDDE